MNVHRIVFWGLLVLAVTLILGPMVVTTRLRVYDPMLDPLNEPYIMYEDITESGEVITRAIYGPSLNPPIVQFLDKFPWLGWLSFFAGIAAIVIAVEQRGRVESAEAAEEWKKERSRRKEVEDYVGNRHSRIYHHIYCPTLGNVTKFTSSDWKDFKSREEIDSLGYRPCRRCLKQHGEPATADVTRHE